MTQKVPPAPREAGRYHHHYRISRTVQRHIINSVTHYSITTTGDVGKPREALSRFFGLIMLEYRFLYLQSKNSFVFRINLVSLHFSLDLKEFVRKCLDQIPIPMSVSIEQC